MESLSAALELYRRGQFAQAEAACDRVLARAADRRDALTLLAEIRSACGRMQAAIENLRELASLAPHDAANLRRLAAALVSVQQPQAAAEVLRRAVAVEPGNVRGHNNLGQVLLQLGEPHAAIRCFEQALSLDPDYAIGRLNLARCLERTDRPQAALAHYDRLVGLHPKNAPAWAKRGALLSRLQRTADALHSVRMALALHPADAQTRIEEAAVLLTLQRPAEAIAAVDCALALAGGGTAGATRALQYKAAALCQLQRPAAALHCIESALEAAPADVEVWCNAAVVHQQLGDHAAATRCYRHALTLDATCIVAHAGLLAASIPAVALTAAESQQARSEFERELAVFEASLEGRQLSASEAWTVARQQLFYLSYQEVSNKAALRRYREMSAARLAPFAPSPQASAPAQAQSAVQSHDARSARRLRLGIVSAHVCDHSVFDAITRGWLQTLSRSHIETTLFSLGTKRDTAIDLARRCVDRCEAEPRALPEWADLIGGQQLDAVIFPEVGLDRNTLALASLRLAPRQFAAWGHPETTGLPTIDAFLSADAFEPHDADEHYRERLVRLPHLGVYYTPYRLEPETLDFAALGIPAEGCVFVCPGAPFKYRPEDDTLLVQIALRLVRCTFVFFTHERQELSNRLRARLIAAFAAAGLDSGLLVFIPWQPRAAFLGLLSQAHVYLDTIGFSGFNTLMHAVEAGLPCVAYEGRFMRGRLGSGILRRLGLPELIAVDKPTYVDLAVRLAEDCTYRAQIARRLRAAAPLAYEDLSAVEALQQVLLS